MLVNVVLRKPDEVHEHPALKPLVLPAILQRLLLRQLRIQGFGSSV